MLCWGSFEEELQPRMNTDGHEFEGKHGELCYQIVGCAFAVHNALGFGLHEKPYENALAVECTYRKLRFSQQARFEVRYRNVKVGEFIPDLIIEKQVIVDTKTINRIGDLERGQMLNYLRLTGLEVGLIINFQNPKVEWRRIILD